MQIERKISNKKKKKKKKLKKKKNKKNDETNNIRGKKTVISAADSKDKDLLNHTNEELMIAMDTAAIVKG